MSSDTKAVLAEVRPQVKSVLARLRLLTRPPVVLGIFLIIYTAFGLAYLGQWQEKRDVVAQLSIGNRVLGQEARSRDKLEEELEAALASLEQVRASFPVTQPSRVLLDSVLRMASESGLEVRKVDVLPIHEEVLKDEPQGEQSKGKEEAKESRYEVSPFSLKGGGTLPQIYAFLDRLENGPLDTLVITETSLSNNGDTFSLAVDFSVYSALPFLDSALP